MTNKPMTYQQAQYTEVGMLYNDWLSADTIACKLTGTYDWQGFIGEILSLSGLGRDIQRVVNKICSGWKVFEYQYGDGTSKYTIGDYKRLPSRKAKVIV